MTGTRPGWASVLPKEAAGGAPPAARRITFVRHGQSQANRDGIWQGAASSPLTERGRAQAERAGARLARRKFDIVQSSDLERCRETAAAAGFTPELDPLWREGDLGEWEGLPFGEVWKRHREYIERIHSGEDLPLGFTGERSSEVAGRGSAAIGSLLSRLDEGGHALVFAHGGLITGVAEDQLGIPIGGRKLGVPSNTAFCQLAFTGSSASLVVYNDASHLGPLGPWVEWAREEGAAVLELVRHGVTVANLARRVQGQSDWGLAPDGRRQAESLGRWIGQVDKVYASPLPRARDTAALAFRHPAETVDGLMEINMGEWEGEMWEELAARGVLDKHRAGGDLPRGGSGETWAELRRRAVKTINGLADAHPGWRVAVTSHGGTIRAYLAGVLGFGYGELGRLGHLANTSVSQVVAGPDGPTITSYNVAGHLEE